MWLLVAAPTVSRALPSTWWSPDLGAWCTGHGLSDQHPTPAGDPADHADKCGYCVLLGHAPLLGGHAAPMVFAAWLPPPAPFVQANAPWHALPLLSANPRGPPSLRYG